MDRLIVSVIFPYFNINTNASTGGHCDLVDVGIALTKRSIFDFSKANGGAARLNIRTAIQGNLVAEHDSRRIIYGIVWLISIISAAHDAKAGIAITNQFVSITVVIIAACRSTCAIWVTDLVVRASWVTFDIAVVDAYRVHLGINTTALPRITIAVVATISE